MLPPVVVVAAAAADDDDDDDRYDCCGQVEFVNNQSEAADCTHSTSSFVL